MAFKLKQAPYDLSSQAPIYYADLEDGVWGKTNNNGSILINNEPTALQNEEDIINHENIHVDQIKRNDLSYDDRNVYWKNKIYPRSEMQEGNYKLPWEAEAYRNS